MAIACRRVLLLFCKFFNQVLEQRSGASVKATLSRFLNGGAGGAWRLGGSGAARELIANARSAALANAAPEDYEASKAEAAAADGASSDEQGALFVVGFENKRDAAGKNKILGSTELALREFHLPTVIVKVGDGGRVAIAWEPV